MDIENFKIDVYRFLSVLTNKGYTVTASETDENVFTLNGVTFTVNGAKVKTDKGYEGSYFSFYGFMKILRKGKAWDCNYTVDRQLERVYMDDSPSPIEIWIDSLDPRPAWAYPKKR